MKYIVESDEHVQMISLIAVREGTAIMITGNVETFQTADKAIDEAYQKGFEAGQHEATTLEYQQGLNDAWGTIIKIALIPYAERSETFDGQQDILSIMQKFSPSEVTAKLREYEQQKADDEIKVGDEVRNKNHNVGWTAVVVQIDGDTIYLMGKTGTVADYRSIFFEKTGRHFPQVEELLKAMQGEQRNCSTCRYDHCSTNGFCKECDGSLSMWKPKEGED